MRYSAFQAEGYSNNEEKKWTKTVLIKETVLSIMVGAFWMADGRSKKIF